MAEILSEEFYAEKIKVPFLEFPTKSQPDSSERKKFWEDLENSISEKALVKEIKDRKKVYEHSLMSPPAG